MTAGQNTSLEKTVRMLLIEPDAEFAKAIEEALSVEDPPYQITHAATLDEARQLLGRHCTDSITYPAGLPDKENLTYTGKNRPRDLYDIILADDDATIGQSGNEQVMEPLERAISPLPLMGIFADQPLAIISKDSRIEAENSALDNNALIYMPRNPGLLGELPRNLRLARRKWEDKKRHMQTQQELTRISRLFKLMMKHASDVIYIVDDQFRITYISESVESILGRSPKDFIGISFPELGILTKRSLEQAIEDSVQILIGKVPVSSVFEFLDKDGRIRNGEVSGAPIIDETGIATGIIAVARDITSRLELEKKLLESADLYKNLVENVRVGMYSLERVSGLDEFRIQNPNKHMCEILGYTRKELSDMNPSDLFFLESRKAFSSRMADIWDRKPAKEGIDLRIRRKDQKALWGHLVSVWEYDCGKPLRAQCVVSDISERKHFEAELQKNNERYQAILENTGSATVLYGNDGIITYCNTQFERLSGLSRDQIVGNLGWCDFVADKDLDKMLAFHKARSAAEAGVPQSYEFDFSDAESRMKNIYVNVGVLSGTNERIASLVDITEMKKAETELRLSQERLQRVAHAEAIGFMTAGIAHDFNNLLSTIAGNAQLMRRNDNLGTSKPYLDSIDTAISRAASLVTKLMGTGRQQEDTLTPVDLNSCISSCIRLVNNADNDSIAIKTDLYESLSQVLASEDQVNRIILNLSRNALDAMENGGTLNYRTRETCYGKAEAMPDALAGMPAAKYVIMEIKDTGSGIAADILGRIFEPYFTTKDIGKGTGLGLSTVHGLMQKYKGGISVESIIGKGTAFTLYFPAYADSCNAQYHKQSDKAGIEKILVADDEEGIRDFCTQMFEMQNYQVITAGDGEEAVRLFEDESPDLVLLDLGLPKKKGYQCLREMQALRPSVKVIICSGMHERIDEPGLTVSAYLDKPLRLEETLRVVRKVLDL